MRLPALGMPPTVTKWIELTLAAGLALGAACVAYGVFVERRWYRTASYRIPLLPDGVAPVRILHLSDLHFVQGDRSKSAFLRRLDPADLTVVTGDILGEPAGVDGVVEALRPLRGRLASYFVLGSNDYWAPQPLNYANYFRKERALRVGVRSRSDALVEALEADGWVHLRNAKAQVSSDGTRVEVLGLDDPHVEYHDLRVAPRTDPEAFGLAVVHSPDPAPELVALGYDLIVSGHTHGGQVRMPVVGALVTNSDMPRRLAMGLSRFARAYVHVSPGLGTSKYAPFRFLCRPEATYLELAPVTDN
jgi:predicted MPP superfamily phosphohydrolase